MNKSLLLKMLRELKALRDPQVAPWRREIARKRLEAFIRLSCGEPPH